MPSLVKIEFVRSDEELFGMFPMYFFTVLLLLVFPIGQERT